MARREANVGIGRYGEARLLYSAPLFSSPQDQLREHRTVHLGVDLFVPAGTAVLAPLDGVVHAVADNRAALDYGPVVILRHRTDAGDAFFTLYGHLRRASIVGLRPGQTIGAGATIAALGTPAENGGWPPHLHFQIVLDLLDLSTDFPGVCRATRWRSGVHSRRIRAACCGCRSEHSPSALLRRPPTARPAATADLYERRRHSLGRNLSIAYRDPIHVVRGWMQYLYDTRAADISTRTTTCRTSATAIRASCRRPQSRCALLNTNTRYLHDDLSALRRTPDRDAARRRSSVCYLRELRQRGERARAAPGARPHAAARTDRSRRRVSRQHDDAHRHQPVQVQRPGRRGARRRGCTSRRCPTTIEARSADDPRAGAKYAAQVARSSTLRASSAGVAAFIAESAPERRRPDRPARPAISRTVYAHRPRRRRRLHRRRGADGLSAAWARTSGRSKRRVSCPTSSSSASRSATGIRSARW